MQQLLISLSALCLFTAHSAQADQQINELTTLIDNQFKDLTQSLDVAQSYRVISTTKPLNTLNFNVGFEVTTTKVEPDSLLEQITPRKSPNALHMPRLHVRKGLPHGWDVGAFYSSLPDTDLQIYGGELRYSLFNQHRSLPALAVRGTYSYLSGVEDLYLTSTGLEFSVSKGFSGLTPYAGFGATWVDGEDELSGYRENLTQTKYFLGLNFNLGLFNFAAETQQNGESSTTKAKFGLRF
ncbi:MAG: hypothetical protein GXP08_07535 [Gammaproteobacteria bacterium]|nr:hypothetical protein [Gammaproteobacteria bacterium]